MPTRLARVALRPVPRRPDPPRREEVEPGAVDAFRARLAGRTAREHVLLDLLDDDLREARVALAAVAAWIAGVEAALRREDVSAERLVSLALGGAAPARIDVGGLVASIRRRLLQVGARM